MLLLIEVAAVKSMGHPPMGTPWDWNTLYSPGGSAAKGSKHHLSDLERHKEPAAGDANSRNNRRHQQSPSLERYLCEGNVAKECRHREREVIPREVLECDSILMGAEMERCQQERYSG